LSVIGEFEEMERSGILAFSFKLILKIILPKITQIQRGNYRVEIWKSTKPTVEYRYNNSTFLSLKLIYYKFNSCHLLDEYPRFPNVYFIPTDSHRNSTNFLLV
jgi:hypothetical protein